MARTRLNSVISFTFNEYISGYHVYRDVWSPQENEILDCSLESTNRHDPNAVAILKNGLIVGHVPRTLARYCSQALKLNATLYVTVTGKYCNPRGNGLEIPCLYTLVGRDAFLKTVMLLIKDYIRRMESSNYA